MRSSVNAAARLDSVVVVHVDDDRDTLALVRLILAREGASVDCFEDTEAALARVREDPPDVLVIDLAMPGKDGFWLLRQVRGLPGKSGLIPAVALTGLTTETTFDECFAAGFQLYVAKPANAEALIGAVAALTGWTAEAPGR
jgi:CheY-like chemotaxis protein